MVRAHGLLELLKARPNSALTESAADRVRNADSHYTRVMAAAFQISEPVREERQDVPVMCMRANSATAEAIQRAWAQFEVRVGLKGRKFFGAFDVGSGEYRACAQLNKDDDPDAFGVEVWTLPGGAYLRARLQGEPPGVYAEIPAVFNRLAKRAASDPSRPSIEFYRSRDVIDLLLPIA